VPFSFTRSIFHVIVIHTYRSLSKGEHVVVKYCNTHKKKDHVFF